eukprot:TRINITY_DN2844_c0_g1_i1.p4 TRINITY_DN2844_c0_g1~~TRINITY_DN2844_c0_g1_i1.p4  ORF type:complete len:243 (-),score=-13.51 TRINITY_DN2844_c0_g1_i1:3103-3831(-)
MTYVTFIKASKCFFLTKIWEHKHMGQCNTALLNFAFGQQIQGHIPAPFMTLKNAIFSGLECSFNTSLIRVLCSSRVLEQISISPRRAATNLCVISKIVDIYSYLECCWGVEQNVWHNTIFKRIVSSLLSSRYPPQLLVLDDILLMISSKQINKGKWMLPGTRGQNFLNQKHRRVFRRNCQPKKQAKSNTQRQKKINQMMYTYSYICTIISVYIILQYLFSFLPQLLFPCVSEYFPHVIDPPM